MPRDDFACPINPKFEKLYGFNVKRNQKEVQETSHFKIKNENWKLKACDNKLFKNLTTITISTTSGNKCTKRLHDREISENRIVKRPQFYTI